MKKSFLLFGLAAFLFACDKDDTVAPPNYPATIFTVTQAPGQRLVFEFSFSADQENLVLVQQAGQVVASRDIDEVDAEKPFDTGYNATGQPITYEITHKFKTSRKDPNWLNGVGRADTINSNKIVFGFDDRAAIDADFNDAVVTLNYSF